MKSLSSTLRCERGATWLELEALVVTVEAKGLQALGAAQVTRLPVLYRETVASLGLARTAALDQDLLAYLEALCNRAYVCVYGPKRHAREVVVDFTLRRFPRALREHRRHIAVAALAFLVGTGVSFATTLGDPEQFYEFVSADYAQSRGPTSSTDELRDVLYDSGGNAADRLTAFATFLFAHNARIGILSFALGFLAGLPVFVLLFSNGLILGAFAALYHGRGIGLDFWAWLMPHAVTEIGALVLCGAAGLVLGESLVFPGRHTRLANLGRRGRDAGVLVIGAVVMFFIAGLVEGLFRQLVQSVPIRLIVAGGSATLWLAYATFAGRVKR